MSLPKVTEDTVTRIVAEELEKLGVKTQVFPTIRTPKGFRKPDIWCANGGVYVIEAKFRENELLNAVAKMYEDYIKWHDILGVKGGFAVLYPQELSKVMKPDELRKAIYKYKFKVIAVFPPKDVRKGFTVEEGSLSEIADYLAKHILTPPEYVEPKVEFIVKTLRDAANYLTTALKHLSGEHIEEFFGGKEVFKNILQYKEGKIPVEDLRIATAYILVNQLLFYHVLSSRMPNRFPKIDDDQIRKPADLQFYFKKVLETNYQVIFSYDITSLIPDKHVDVVKALINVINGLSPEKVGGDLLGTIFHDLIPRDVRKVVAAYYTNVMAAELLAWLSIDHHDYKVADFAVGSGGLLVAAYRRKKYLLERLRRFMEADHKKFVEEDLLGVDVMPFAASIAACNLALQSPEYFTNKVNIAVWDSTELEPGKSIPSLAGIGYVLKGQTTLMMFTKNAKQELAKGVISITGRPLDEIKLEKYDVVIMNPPFTRQEKIPKVYKKLLITRFSEYKEYIHGQMGYYGYFILLADKFLKDGGRIALVLPATVLHRRSAEGIRKLWSEKYEVEYIITTWHRFAFSESTYFRDTLIVARKKQPSSDAFVKVCVLKKLPETYQKARELAEKLRNITSDYEDEEVVVELIPYSNFLADTADWFKYISLSDLKLIDELVGLLSSNVLTPLAKLAETHRADLEHFKSVDFHGFVLRNEDRTEKGTDLWVLVKENPDTIVARHRDLNILIEIPRSCLVRGLRRLSHVDTMDVTNFSDYLIVDWFDKLPYMARFILKEKELSMFNEGIVREWRRNYEARKAHLVLARRLYMASPGTHLIAFYSDDPIVGVDFWSVKNVDRELAKILTLWLNSSINILQLLYLGVACEGSWMKLHEYMLKRLFVPNPAMMSSDKKQMLLGVFDKVRNVRFKGLFQQFVEGNETRGLIDRAWLKILGYQGDHDKFLSRMHQAIAKELQLIRQQEESH